MTVTEPMTMATDYLLTVVCAFFAVSMVRHYDDHPAVLLWILAFGVGGVAALLGGTHHGFKTRFDPGLAKGLWEFTLITIGASAAFMIAAAVMSSIEQPAGSSAWIRAGLIVSALGFAVQKSGWDLHVHFNHNDIFHVIQVAGYWCLYEGARRLEG